MARVIHPDRLLRTPAGRICFDPGGEAVADDLPPGSAVILVSPLTDSVKTVEHGMVKASVDRDRAARVISLALERDVLESLGPRPLRTEDLIDAVRESGVAWVVVRQDGPLRPLSAQ